MKRCHQLLDFPGLGRRRDDIRSGYRSLTEGEYIIIYRHAENEIVIIRVIHSKRDLPTALLET